MAGEGSPAADADLVFMTRLLQLAVACRAMLRERAFAFAPASLELLHTFYPLLMTAMVEAELHDADTIDGALKVALLQHWLCEPLCRGQSQCWFGLARKCCSTKRRQTSRVSCSP